jgi:hypothetical protein
MRPLPACSHPSHRPVIGLLLAAACAAASALPSSAQGPKPPGTFGFEVVVEDPGPGLSDVLVVLATQGAVPGTPLAPFLSIPLGVDVNGDGIPDPIKVNAAENGTTWQVRTAPEIVIANDPVLGGQIVFVPATIPLFGTSVVSFVDFRGGLPGVPGLAFGVSLTDIPFKLLDDGAGRLYVAESVPGPAGVMTVAEITFAGFTTPFLSAAALVSGLDAEFQDRMALGAGGASLSIAHSGGVDVFSVPGLGFIGTVPMPLGPTGVPFVPFTNILGGLPGPFDMLAFAGQPGGGPGHTFVTWSSVTGLPGPTGGINPAGPNVRTAPGFHEPAFTPTSPTKGTVTALLDNLPFGGGAGVIFQIPFSLAGPAAPVITPALSPFGDPEPARNGFADPIGFQSGTAVGDFFSAVTAGAVGPLGSLSAPNLLTGFLNPGDSPRPLAMSLPGFTGSDFALTTTIGTPTVHIFGVTPAPVAFPTATFPSGAGLSSLGTVWMQAAVGGALPVHFQQAAGVGVMAQAGFPLSVPPLSLVAPAIGIPAIPISGFVTVPVAQSVTPVVSAALSGLNYTVPGVLGSWVTVHPSPGIAPPFFGTLTIAPAPSYGLAAAFYPGSGAFVTEVRSF